MQKENLFFFECKLSFRLLNHKLFTLMDVETLFESVGRDLYTMKTVERTVGIVLHIRKNKNGGIARSFPCPSHLSLSQQAAFLAPQKSHLGQVAISIAWSEKRGGVCGDKHVGSDRHGSLCWCKGIVVDGALGSVAVNQVPALRRVGEGERHVILQDVTVARYIDSLLVGFPVDHVVIRTVVP